MLDVETKRGQDKRPMGRQRAAGSAVRPVGPGGHTWVKTWMCHYLPMWLWGVLADLSEYLINGFHMILSSSPQNAITQHINGWGLVWGRAFHFLLPFAFTSLWCLPLEENGLKRKEVEYSFIAFEAYFLMLSQVWHQSRWALGCLLAPQRVIPHISVRAAASLVQTPETYFSSQVVLCSHPACWAENVPLLTP